MVAKIADGGCVLVYDLTFFAIQPDSIEGSLTVVIIPLMKDFANRLEGTAEKILAKRLETSTGEICKRRYPRKGSQSQWRFGRRTREYAWQDRMLWKDDVGLKTNPCSCV